jgi:hypothetical protein
MSVKFSIEDIHIIPQSTSELHKNQRSENNALFRGVKQSLSELSTFILGRYKRTLLSICKFREDLGKEDRILLWGVNEITVRVQRETE